jgi:hypothetical protein
MIESNCRAIVLALPENRGHIYRNFLISRQLRQCRDVAEKAATAQFSVGHRQFLQQTKQHR